MFQVGRVNRDGSVAYIYTGIVPEDIADLPTRALMLSNYFVVKLVPTTDIWEA